MKTYVHYGRTISQNYQSRKAEHGLDIDTKIDGSRIARARQLCRAMVHDELDLKIGMTRKTLDELANEFYDCSWKELSTGIAEADEAL